MRRLLLIFLTVSQFASCASSGNGPAKRKIAEPAIGLEQVVGPKQLNYPYGQIEVQYNLAVENRAAEPITLIRVEVSTSNPEGGAYSLRRDSYFFRETIPPNSGRVVSFWAKAFAWGRGVRENEPVTVRGVAYFQSPAGALQKVFIRELSQYE